MELVEALRIGFYMTWGINKIHIANYCEYEEGVEKIENYLACYLVVKQ